MGFFGILFTQYRMSQAAVVIQNAMEGQRKFGLFSGDPHMFSNKLVKDIWEKSPDAFDGSNHQRPNKLTIAATATANGIFVFKNDTEIRNNCIIALGEIIKAIEILEPVIKNKEPDKHMIKEACDIYFHAVGLSEKTQTQIKINTTENEIDENYNSIMSNDNFCRHMAIGANIINQQLEMYFGEFGQHDGGINIIFIRGYMLGVFDSAIQCSKVSIKHQDVTINLIAAGHSQIIASDAFDFTMESLKLQKNEEFFRGQQIGGDDYFRYITNKIEFPDELFKYLSGRNRR